MRETSQMKVTALKGQLEGLICDHSGTKCMYVQISMPRDREQTDWPLRTVPTIVIAHTFCASSDTRISYRQCLLIQGYFCAV